MNHANVNVNFMVENITQIKIGIKINVGVSAKTQENIIFAKVFIFGIIEHLLVKMVNIYKVLLVIQ